MPALGELLGMAINDNGNKLPPDPWTKSHRSFTRDLKMKAAIGKNYVWIWNYLKNEADDFNWIVPPMKNADIAKATDEDTKTVRRALAKWEKNKLIKKHQVGRSEGNEIEFLVYEKRVRGRTPVSTLNNENKGQGGTPVSTLGTPVSTLGTPVSTLSEKGKPVSDCNINQNPVDKLLVKTPKESLKNIKEKGGDKNTPAFFSEDEKTAAYCLKSFLAEFPKNSAKGDLQKWTRDIRLMREEDGRTHAEIIKFWDWARAHTRYWAKRIISPATLRKNVKTLEPDWKADQGKTQNRCIYGEGFSF